MTEKIINIAFLLVLPFLYTGIINKTKAFWSGRKGASIVQPFFDFVRLLKKGEVISRTTSIIFQIAPSVSFASVLFAGLLVPMAGSIAVLPFDGDFILFAYILATGKFLSILGALDTGSSFEGMGASREAAFTSLIEPAFFIILASLSMLSGSFSFEKILSLPYLDNGLKALILSLTVASLFIMLITEGSRVPVDDPNTHLELTMIHEVMVLDNSGPDLALINYTAGMKMVVITSLIASLIIPRGPGLLYSVLLFTGVQLISAIIIGCVESFTARLRMSQVPQFILLMTSLALITLSVIAFFTFGGRQ